MSMILAVLRETLVGERRVAMVPSQVSKFSKLGFTVSMERGAGDAAKFRDSDYADVEFADEPRGLVSKADIVLAVQPPPPELVATMRPGAWLMCMVYPQKVPELLQVLRDGRISCMALESVPRISRAQAMDVLSSQAALAGYLAPMIGATHLPRILPMMTTAVGSLRAGRVLVMGLGVAGLQALATAHRLGAITEGYDVRPETREQAQSVGAKFVETGIDARGEGGYARQLTAAEQAQASAVLTKHIQQADMIITTANVPGRRAPVLVTKAQIEGMKSGSVIVDLAADSGCNCEGAMPGGEVEIGPVTVLAPFNVPSQLPQHSSELYCRNLLALLVLMVKDGAIAPDMDDEVVAGTLLSHEGKILPAAAAALLEKEV
ncbi:TPA: NAD(P) transhydrogenase subunit alpha [Stenotrophomonas maltophilia]|uniref:NAD(P) transhydrogenase subunit alpha n=1 Tax=unclassified Stenotrophomonas TaxID=196198 RepID=UPI002447B4D7|nr:MULTISPECIES: NAD(P) transhydrogenase subunit alpha [unclassified Stenotrophomonas]HDS1366073.1 NAD(P) transhydrogenase subunit alpha [Stenotrophomonas maltophilia]MDH0190170.1 NAD(P) transhydrogenase subunit alpha [Stenotrophomonas sp. GD04051]MDH0463924.1 NAD(P) transhydrogenase subunit alpha [Stenotrophomonas sp. GD03993]MDH0874546.1 NAD(P) transhydrogenase subunit alpha [Stenotrophomonas sp. GD03877]MDH2155169.1 NAD(P) transhydrogenase subunit alpha [Stenotrophomonas sp. GD03657]